MNPETQTQSNLAASPAGQRGSLSVTAWFGRLRVRLQNLRCWKTQWAYRTLTKAMKRDPDFAHTWQCNIACPLMDAGMNHIDANAAADRLMRHLFGVVNYTEPNSVVSHTGALPDSKISNQAPSPGVGL